MHGYEWNICTQTDRDREKERAQQKLKTNGVK